jgi:hypothetical protein
MIVAMPVITASRCGLNIDDRPRADLESSPQAEPPLLRRNVSTTGTVAQRDATELLGIEFVCLT